MAIIYTDAHHYVWQQIWESFPEGIIRIKAGNNMEQMDTLDKANSYIQNIPEVEQAYLYKALYLNDMRIDRAENIIRKSKEKK